MSQGILEIEGLNKSFGGLHATNNLSLRLEPGEQSAIIGPNGAGKSTLFNLITGYHVPDSGQVKFMGRDITRRAPHRIAMDGITRAFQVSNIFTQLTVWENVRSAVQARRGLEFNLYKLARRVGNRETGEILERCALTERRKVVAGELSQGDKKKLELAIALAGKPKLLLLDEPTAGMSLDETREAMALVDRLNQELKVTILFTEHDMSVVFRHARKVSLLHRGELLFTGSPQEVRENPLVQKIYLGEHS
ncbi:MAG: ABC transporter ATP-binding protein [Desulfarculaceae bacterium]|nr:ABC transporter ATP-binding protein [Desulfarculaceae bacterium]